MAIHRYLMRATMGMAQRSSSKGPHFIFELNDLFFVVYAVPSATLSYHRFRVQSSLWSRSRLWHSTLWNYLFFGS